MEMEKLSVSPLVFSSLSWWGEKIGFQEDKVMLTWAPFPHHGARNHGPRGKAYPEPPLGTQHPGIPVQMDTSPLPGHKKGQPQHRPGYQWPWCGQGAAGLPRRECGWNVDIWVGVSTHVHTRPRPLCCEMKSQVRREGSHAGVQGQLSHAAMSWCGMLNLNLAFQVLVRIYLSRQTPEHILFRSLLAWFLTFKYLNIWHVGFHLYLCPKICKYQVQTCWRKNGKDTLMPNLPYATREIILGKTLDVGH